MLSFLSSFSSRKEPSRACVVCLQAFLPLLPPKLRKNSHLACAYLADHLGTGVVHFRPFFFPLLLLSSISLHVLCSHLESYNFGGSGVIIQSILPLRLCFLSPDILPPKTRARAREQRFFVCSKFRSLACAHHDFRHTHLVTIFHSGRLLWKTSLLSGRFWSNTGAFSQFAVRQLQPSSASHFHIYLCLSDSRITTSRSHDSSRFIFEIPLFH